MYQIASASALTWTLSFLSSSFVSHTLDNQSNIWLKRADRLCRGAMLGLVLAEQLPHNITHFGSIMTLVATIGILSLIHTMETLYSYACTQSQACHKLWSNYILLAPHCIMEGFAAAPYFMAEHLDYTFICLFLWHKVSELSMITASTRLTITDATQRRIIQHTLILLTPLAMCLGAYIQSDLHVSETTHTLFEIINMSIYIHIALFCPFCNCKKQGTHNVHVDRYFLLACSTLYLALTFLAPGAHPCPHAHKHTHGHESSHCHDCDHHH